MFTAPKTPASSGARSGSQVSATALSPSPRWTLEVFRGYPRDITLTNILYTEPNSLDAKCDLFGLDCVPPSPDEITNLVRSGRAPDSVGERLILAQKLQAAQEGLDRFQRELDRLQNEIKAAEIQKQLFLSQRDQLHSILASPIRKLPSEMLLEIFSDLCTTPEANYISDPLVLQTAALSQVCIRWYNLVHGTPALWSRFAIHMPLKGVVVSFLERSCSHPIDFNLYPIYYMSNVVTLITTPAVSDRWSRVQLFNIDHLLGQKFLQLPTDVEVTTSRTFPQLLSLSMQTISDNVAYLMPHCPKLHSLTLRKVHLHRHQSSPYLTTVRKLHLDNLTPAQVFDVLESCPNVEDISLGLIQPNLGQPLPHLICSYIRKLKLTYDVRVAGSLSMLLDNLTIPALTHLLIYRYESLALEVHTSFFESISSMLGCSVIVVSSVGGNMVCTSVTHLCLDSPVGFSDLEIRGLFAALPCVTQFEYTEGRDRQDTVEWVIQSLIAPQARTHSDGWKEDGDYNRQHTSQGGLFPYLQNLILDLYPPIDLLIQLIMSRRRPQESHLVDSGQFVAPEKLVCLQRVEIWVQSSDSVMIEELRRRCQSFCDEGLVVEIR